MVYYNNHALVVNHDHHDHHDHYVMRACLKLRRGIFRLQKVKIGRLQAFKFQF